MHIRHPGPWSETSYDFKLMFIHHGATLVMFALGDTLSIRDQVWIWVVLVSILLSLSIRHRRQVNWRWPGATWANYLQAVVMIVVGAIFLMSSIPLFPPLTPRALPWYLSALGLTLFGSGVHAAHHDNLGGRLCFSRSSRR